MDLDPLSHVPTTHSNRSRAESELENISRLYSGQFLDDASVYLSDGELEERAEEEDEEGKEERERRQHRYEADQGRKSDTIESEYESAEPSTSGESADVDLEKGGTLEKSQTRQEKEEQPRDPKLVCFAGPDDPESPKNWTIKQKWMATVIVSCFTLMSPMSSSMVAPSLEAIAKEFHIADKVEMELTMSVFILAYAVGPLFLGPLSEIFGRVIVLQLSNLFYLAFNIGCGVSRSKGQLIAFRFLSGLGGSAPLAVSSVPRWVDSNGLY